MPASKQRGMPIEAVCAMGPGGLWVQASRSRHFLDLMYKTAHHQDSTQMDSFALLSITQLFNDKQV